jgi:CRP-like cAMP-binding protein
MEKRKSNETKALLPTRPQFVVLDLAQVPNLDASAARGCFLQLSRVCAKRGILVCAAGACPRAEWMLRSHDVAYDLEKEESNKDQLQRDPDSFNVRGENNNKMLLFLTIYEALEFCENQLIHQLTKQQPMMKNSSFVRLDELTDDSSPISIAPVSSLGEVFSHILGLTMHETELLVERLKDIGDNTFHDESTYAAGDVVFRYNSNADEFFVVLRGGVALIRGEPTRQRTAKIISGAGEVKQLQGSFSNLVEAGDVKAFLRVGGIFGFVDFILDRPRLFSAMASTENTVIARLSRTKLDRIKDENPELGKIVARVLLHASVLELANCTCCE